MARHAWLPLLLLAAWLPLATADAEERVSGTVLSVDRAAGVLVVEELTASAGPTPTPAQRRFTLAPNATVSLVRRAPDTPAGWPYGYAATPLSVEDLRPGDFVTVTFVRDGDRRLAQQISVVRPQHDAPAGTGQR